MLNKIISFSLRNRLAVLLGAALLVIAGLYTARTMEVDVFPDLNAPTVVVMTEAKGMAPESNQQSITSGTLFMVLPHLGQVQVISSM